MGSSGVQEGMGRAGAFAPGPELCPQTLCLLLQDSGPNKVSSASSLLGEGLSPWWGRGRRWSLGHSSPARSWAGPVSGEQAAGWMRDGRRLGDNHELTGTSTGMSLVKDRAGL